MDEVEIPIKWATRLLMPGIQPCLLNGTGGWPVEGMGDVIDHVHQHYNQIIMPILPPS